MKRKTFRDRGVMTQRTVALNESPPCVELEFELQARCGNIPRYVLATGKEVVVMMIHRIHL